MPIEADPLKSTSPKSAALMGLQGLGDTFPEPRDWGLRRASAGIKQGSTGVVSSGAPEWTLILFMGRGVSLCPPRDTST